VTSTGQRVNGDTYQLLATIQSWGITKVEFTETRDAALIPWVLKLPFMVDTMGLLYRQKRRTRTGEELTCARARRVGHHA
jgi:hypothetical protein